MIENVVELPPLLTVDEVATALRIGRTSVYKLTTTGRLPRVRLLDRALYRASDVAKLLEPEAA